MQPHVDLSVLSLITGASLPVQLIMTLLAVLSILSWTFIFNKWFLLRSEKDATVDFENHFWSGTDLDSLLKQTQSYGFQQGVLAQIFQAGMVEFRKSQHLRTHSAMMMDGVRRAMRAEYQRQLELLERHLSFLASTASVSVYIGLFGTVWGIMNSFRGLASMQQATLASVAPGIAEALIATAIGLFAAIPAFVAYNTFSQHIDRLCGRFETFIDEFSNILQRQTST